ncbi:MAG: methyltransferase family protein, partial [Beijerinckiaceae bacterium]
DPLDRPNSIPWPPILYAAGLALPWLLDSLIPLPALALPEPFDAIQAGVGWGVVAAGVAIAWFAIRSFMGADTAIHPTHAARRLVTFGIYNRTRNPMYLGAMVAFLGIAIATGNIWRVMALPVLFMGLQNLAIIREEAHLAARFGAEWTEYAGRVRRWW